MPNIYIRLPLSRCQFFRHREPDYILQHEEPVVFNAYTHEYFIMRNSLINAAKNTHVDMACFSQQQWCNMLTGKSPSGGKVMIARDANDWLSYNEVQQLNGRKDFSERRLPLHPSAQRSGNCRYGLSCKTYLYARYARCKATRSLTE